MKASRNADGAATAARPDSRAAGHAAGGGYVLITGGAGFIGTNLAKRYAAAGRPVVLYDNLSRPGVERNVEWLLARHPDLVTLREADILDEEPLDEAVAGAGLVFHFAAQVAVTTSLASPRHDFDVNARGTLNVLEACRLRETPPPLLFTSTNKVYGGLEDVEMVLGGTRYEPADPHVRRHGVGEARPLDFHSPYGCSKGTADQYVRDYARCYGLPTVDFRMSCIYGPHQCGTEDQGWVAHFARAILAGEPLNIYGDGYQVRDLLFVEDLTRAMQTAVEQIGTTRGEVFNMGGGPDNAASVHEVIEGLGRLHGEPPEARSGPWRQGDQKYYVSDVRKFQEQTGWRPKVNVEEGLGRLYEWLAQAARPAKVPAGR